MPANQAHDSVQYQLEQEAVIVILTADEAISDIHLYRETLELLVEAETALRIVRDIVWVELSVEQIEELLENMEDSDYDLVVSIQILFDDEDDEDADSENLYFVIADVNFAVGDNVIQGFDNSFTLYVDLSDFNLQGLNRHRVTAIHDGRNIGGSLNPVTGIFTIEITATGEFTIAYVETLRRITMQLESPTIFDLAGNAETQHMDVLPVLVSGRTLLPVRFIGYALGAEVDWTPATDHSPMLVHLDLDGHTLTFGIGEMAQGMDVPAQVVESRTMVPLRFISEFFGATVLWDGETRSIEIVR